MRIAFVSREYAGVGSGGGIGTYVRNAAQMLAARGHDVEVFTDGPQDSRVEQPGLRVHSIAADEDDFSRAIAVPFLAAHREKPFDVIESAEYRADAEIVFDQAPEVARVVKLHTAAFQLGAMNEAYVTLGAKARFVAGALRRGQIPKPFWGRYSAKTDPECRITLLADEITAPSAAILAWTGRVWPIDAERFNVIPNVYVPSPDMLAARPEGRMPLVVFVGKLEARKGVIELARAIPKILDAHPDARFRFVGRTLPHPSTRQSLDETVRQEAGSAALDRLEFTGGVAYPEVAGHLAEAAVAVFPSYWENYGYVCLEAMAAGCGVVASSTGGMAELISDGDTGLLVPAKDPPAIARAVIALLSNPAESATMGTKARSSVLECYSNDAIAPLQEASYRRAIVRARSRRRASGPE